MKDAGASRALPVLVLAVTASCSLIVPSATELAGGAGHGSEADGAGIDAGTVPGLRDLSTLPCAEMSPAPRFCDDFEHASPSTDWDAVSQSAGGSVAIDSSDARSPTRSLLCTTPSSTGTTNAPIANVNRFFADTMSDIWIRFDWKIASAPVNGRLVIALLRLGPSTNSAATLGFQFDIQPGQATLEEADYRTSPNGVLSPHSLAGAVQFGTWQYVQVHITLTASLRLSVTIDNSTVVDDPLFSPNPSPSPGALYAGIFYSVPGDPYTVHIDNVTLDY